ncbi:hypothetical protein LENED_006288 [Lentinula edodes]|uniref:DUF6533 domain-containing protein n=1 Tax=Lentinula edodes TaxID=5353 RepID=A0A1Q3EB78_LENED|nr:hypothetical protein LENED_006288 [Lentinula edodes]
MSTASELEYIQFGDILFSSALALLYYDHLLTLDAEIKLIWKRSRNSSRYLFLFNRYLAFFGNIAAAYPVYSSSLTLSVRIWNFTGILILRVNRYKHYFTVNGGGPKMAIGWEGILLLDTILFALTLWKGYHHRLPIGTNRLGVSLFAVVVRDGSIYFFIVASLNLANIISFYTPGRLQGNFSNFVGCISVTLMSRMMLDLHEAAEMGIYTTNAHALTQDIWVDREIQGVLSVLKITTLSSDTVAQSHSHFPPITLILCRSSRRVCLKVQVLPRRRRRADKHATPGQVASSGAESTEDEGLKKDRGDEADRKILTYRWYLIKIGGRRFHMTTDRNLARVPLNALRTLLRYRGPSVNWKSQSNRNWESETLKFRQ